MTGLFLHRPWRLLRLVRVLPALAGFFLGLCGRGELKAAIARAAFGGMVRPEVSQWVATYVSRVVPEALFGAALQAIAAHRAAGDYLVLMSASPDLYVPALGRALGFDETICTELSWRGERFEGRLASPNRRGEEKRRCLDRLRAAHPGLRVFGYGNSAPDLPHLRACDEAVYVNASVGARTRLQSLGIRTVDWR
jgi:phosphatidylglycerophosphatase C